MQFSYTQVNNAYIPDYADEEVDFSVKYGIFKIGEAHLDFHIDQNCHGANIQAHARSSGILKFFKDILFKYQCCMDLITGLPFSDSRILIEDDYVDVNTVYYDHLSREDSSLVYSQKTDTVVVPKNIFDLLSGFYHYRTNCLNDKLPPDHTFSATTFFIDEVWDLKIRYCGKENIKTIYGSIECLKIKPLTKIGHFFHSTDAMSIWFANYGNYIPVKFEVDLKLGTLVGNISGYRIEGVENNLQSIID